MNTIPLDHPITASIEWLVACGWTKEQSTALCRAIRSDKSAQHLWQIAPQWLEFAGDAKKLILLIDLVAQGLANVTQDDSGEWVYSISETGIKVAKQLTVGVATPQA